MKFSKLIPLVIIPLILLMACGVTTQPLTATAPAITQPPTTPTMASSTSAPTPVAVGTLSVGDQLAQIDDILKQSLSASIAYNEPKSMTLDETTTIELLLNPSLSPQALSTQVTAGGQVASASVEITPRMKALLIADDSEAFTIQPVHDDPEQLVSGTGTTQWTWRVTARKSGSQRLTLTLYRLVQYQGQDYWREIQTYQANIDVQVTLAQRIESLDWKWFAGILLTALLIPAFWRWMDSRKKKSDSKKAEPKRKSA